MTKSRRSGWLVPCMRLALAPVLSMPWAWAQQGAPAMPQPSADGRAPTQDPLNLTPVWVSSSPPNTFRGFPVFPTALQGYGAYPTAPGTQGAPAAGNGFGSLFGGNRLGPPVLQLLPRRPPLPPAEPENGWPGWARLRERKPLPYAEDMALLVRHSERVWWRAASDEPHVPMAFHDKLRTLQAGADVEVRQAGDFELLLHDGGYVVSRGPAAMAIEKLDAGEVALRFARLTRLHLVGRERAQKIVLPDGSLLLWGAATQEQQGEPVDVNVERLTREPGWLGGRARITNYGRREVVFRHAFGEQTLRAGERLSFFLAASASDVGAALVTRDLEVQRAAGTATCKAGATAGEVRWCGASFTVPAGRSLRLEALQGDPFAVTATPVSPAGP
jgi:hypothetical protein